MVLMMAVVVTAAAALTACNLLGRYRPWPPGRPGCQGRFTGTWFRGGTGRQAVVVLVHAVTAPRTSHSRLPSTQRSGCEEKSGLQVKIVTLMLPS
ncbi:hypothetical protein ACIOHE_38655 [Streptomyces sp. NPDC087851]|uniref:hypothetical protein n=1 Tax=Streptomyces sp. NPDC087851 TaxID=3365810 RepID=UPI00382B3B5F